MVECTMQLTLKFDHMNTGMVVLHGLNYALVIKLCVQGAFCNFIIQVWTRIDFAACLMIISFDNPEIIVTIYFAN